MFSLLYVAMWMETVASADHPSMKSMELALRQKDG